MDSETVKWISGLIIVNVTAWSVAMGMIKTLLNCAKHTEEKTDLVIEMHNNADKVAEANDRHARELVYYMKWFVKTTTGKEPEPFIDGRH